MRRALLLLLALGVGGAARAHPAHAQPAQAALELQAAQNQLETTENSLAAGRALVAQRELSLETTRTRLRLGLVPALEVERAEAELLAARVERGRLEDNALLARLVLLQTLAIDPLEVF